MKITESTSISLKLIIMVVPLIGGFGGWMWKMDSSVVDLKRGMTSIKRMVKEIRDKDNSTAWRGEDEDVTDEDDDSEKRFADKFKEAQRIPSDDISW